MGLDFGGGSTSVPAQSLTTQHGTGVGGDFLGFGGSSSVPQPPPSN